MLISPVHTYRRHSLLFLSMPCAVFQIGTWFRTAFDELSKAPRYLVPCYFDALVTGVYNIAEEVFWNKMSPYVITSLTFY